MHTPIRRGYQYTVILFGMQAAQSRWVSLHQPMIK